MVSKTSTSISKEQCRAARGWLGISQEELSVAAGVNQKTIARFETGAVVPYDRTLRDLQACLEAKGIEFLFDGSTRVGIRIRSRT
ncbi:MAG: helix-turn-helix domain-containing protein [Pseudolabrys sp.]